MALFSRTETTIAINASEHLCVVGDLNDYDFTYHMYSEAFEKWINQDLDLLKKYHSDSYEKLIQKIEAQLLKDGSQNESSRDI